MPPPTMPPPDIEDKWQCSQCATTFLEPGFLENAGCCTCGGMMYKMEELQTASSLDRWDFAFTLASRVTGEIGSLMQVSKYKHTRKSLLVSGSRNKSQLTMSSHCSCVLAAEEAVRTLNQACKQSEHMAGNVEPVSACDSDERNRSYIKHRRQENQSQACCFRDVLRWFTDEVAHAI